jgi:hypothetical protein
MCMVLALSLVSAGTAGAKEPVKAKVCGESDCRTVKDRDALMALSEGGPPTDSPKRAAAWYSVLITVQIGDDQFDHFRLAVVPSLGLLRSSDVSEGFVFMPAPDRTIREYRRATRGLEPFPAGTLKGVAARSAKEPRQDGDSSPLPWIAGGVVLLGLAGLVIRRS